MSIFSWYGGQNCLLGEVLLSAISREGRPINLISEAKRVEMVCGDTDHGGSSTGSPTMVKQFVGELVFENGSLTDINHELGRVLANNSFKYQYYLTDHLGSTRVVLQEDPMVFTTTAGLESPDMAEESEQFIGYEEVVRISADMLNHTEGAESSYAMRLSGGYGENVGLAKSISVMPGDTVRMEVFGKYIDIAEAKRNPAVMAVLMAITAADPIGMGVDGALATSANSLGAESGGLAGLLTSSKEIGDAPPAFLNYLFFDSEMNYKYGGFIQMSNEGREDGSNVPHERLAQEVVAEEAGYFYIYLSNESQTGSEAFFDDFSIQVSESFIVQQIDYYPYGMIARNVARTTDKLTKDLFQGKTYEDLTKWYDFHARQYDASLGRWFGVDPQDQFASPYLAMGNNPVMGIDPDGEWVHIAIGAFIGGAVNWFANGAQFNKQGLGFFAVGALAGALGAGVGAGISSAMAGGSFGAGFIGSQAAMTATSSFISGATIGGGSGFTGGFTTGFGNSLVSGGGFRSSIQSGLQAGAIGGFSGGLLGGLAGGIDAALDGRRFFDGASVNDRILSDRAIPFVAQEGKYNCGPACGEAISDSRGGNVTQSSIRSRLGGDPRTSPLGDVDVMKEFSSQTGINHKVLAGGLPEIEINSLSSKGWDILFNVRSEAGIGHGVVLNRITERTITKISGKVVTKYLYDVMNPARGQYIRTSPSLLRNAFNTFLVWPRR